MTTDRNRASGSVSRLLATYSQANLQQRLTPKFDHFPTRVPYSAQTPGPSRCGKEEPFIPALKGRCFLARRCKEYLYFSTKSAALARR